MNSDNESNSDDDSVTDPTFIAPSDMAEDYELDEIVAERSNFIDQDKFPMNFEDSDCQVSHVPDNTTEESSRESQQRSRRVTTTWTQCRSVTTIHEFEDSDENINDSLKAPIKYFKDFISDDLLELFVEQSNLYAIQTNANKTLNIDINQLEQWVGLCIYFLISKLSKARQH